jgi:CRP/FNR family transcriptional regulator, cyclic AMP receptor protein
MKKVLYILSVLDDQDVRWLGESGVRRTLAAGDVLIREGGAINSIFFILDGQMSVTVKGRSVAEVGAGEVVGEVSFVDQYPPTATVTALAATRVLEVPRATLERKIAADLGFSSRFYHAVCTFLADRLRSTLGQSSGATERDDALDELDLDKLHAVSKAGERFKRVLQTLG